MDTKQQAGRQKLEKVEKTIKFLEKLSVKWLGDDPGRSDVYRLVAEWLREDLGLDKS